MSNEKKMTSFLYWLIIQFIYLDQSDMQKKIFRVLIKFVNLIE